MPPIKEIVNPTNADSGHQVKKIVQSGGIIRYYMEDGTEIPVLANGEKVNSENWKKLLDRALTTRSGERKQGWISGFQGN